MALFGPCILDAQRLAMLSRYNFVKVRVFEGYPVYCPGNTYTRDRAFEDAYAYQLGRGIFCRTRKDAHNIPLLAHELEHIYQLEEYGLLYPILYELENLWNGYDNNWFEREATKAERRWAAKIRRKKLGA